MPRPRGRPAPAVPARGSPAPLLRALVHELGNLLAAVRLSAHFLRSQTAAGERVALAREVDRVAVLSAAYLAAVRPLLAAVPEWSGPAKLPALLGGVARALEEVAPDSTRLDFQQPDDLPEVSVDADALHHVLVLLLLGAILGAGDAGVTLRVSAAAKGRSVVVLARDDGPAIAPLPTRARPGRSGRALQLSIADAVVRLAGGRVRTRTGAGGSQVEVHLLRAPRRARAALKRSG